MIVLPTQTEKMSVDLRLTFNKGLWQHIFIKMKTLWEELVTFSVIPATKEFPKMGINDAWSDVPSQIWAESLPNLSKVHNLVARGEAHQDCLAFQKFETGAKTFHVS